MRVTVEAAKIGVATWDNGKARHVVKGCIETDGWVKEFSNPCIEIALKYKINKYT